MAAHRSWSGGGGLWHAGEGAAAVGGDVRE